MKDNSNNENNINVASNVPENNNTDTPNINLSKNGKNIESQPNIRKNIINNSGNFSGGFNYDVNASSNVNSDLRKNDGNNKSIEIGNNTSNVNRDIPNISNDLSNIGGNTNTLNNDNGLNDNISSPSSLNKADGLNSKPSGLNNNVVPNNFGGLRQPRRFGAMRNQVDNQDNENPINRRGIKNNKEDYNKNLSNYNPNSDVNNQNDNNQSSIDDKQNNDNNNQNNNTKVDNVNQNNNKNNNQNSVSNTPVNVNPRRNNNPINNVKNNPLSSTIDDKANKIRNNNKKKNDQNSNQSQDDKNAKQNQENREKSASGKVASTLGAQDKVKEAVEGIGEQAESVISHAQNFAEQKVKKMAFKEVFLAILSKIAIPVLVFLGVVLAAGLLFVLLLAVFSLFLDERVSIPTISVDYCEQVNVKWVDSEGNNKEQTVSSNAFIAYQMTSKYYDKIDNEDVLKALAIIHRTNLYYLANSETNDSCDIEIDEEYSDSSESSDNQALLDAIKNTDNKIFTTNKNQLSELKIDDNFTYREIRDILDGPAYVLYQDSMNYMKEWVDENVDEEYIKEGTVDKKTFSPWAAWYQVEKMDLNYQGILYHFYDNRANQEDIYQVEKKSDFNDMYSNTFCSDIPLNETTLSREEFIKYVESNVNNDVFKRNAGKIYDISVANDFNPEMVVVRAMNEGFSPGGNTNNYWGIGCFNGASAYQCTHYPSFDAGVLGYINNIKNNGYQTAFQMMQKYAYIGKYWFNPGGSGLGGCYYFPYIKEYLSEERIAVVEEACSSGKSCPKTGGADCVPTTDEDQDAYAKWQVSKMSSTRSAVFELSPDVCAEEGSTVETGDLDTLGARVAQYAVATYDGWQYSQNKRHQDGFVDCSSMVARAYGHFNYKIYDSSDTSGEIYRWCEKNGKTISKGELKAGDLIFNTSGSSSNYKSINHVSMYIGNNQIFAAHGTTKTVNGKTVSRPIEDQVSVTNYNGGGTYFCSPTK